MPNFGRRLPGGFPAAISDVPTNAQVLTFNDANKNWDAQDAGGGGSGFTTVFKSADETIASDDTLTDDSDLTFSVDASSFYFFILRMEINSPITPDFKYIMSLPVGATGNWTKAGAFLSPSSETYDPDSVLTQIFFSTAGANDNLLFQVGYLETDTTAGTAAVQWAQNTSNAGATTVRKGSTMMFKKLN